MNIEKFKSKYPREVRQNCQLSPEYIDKSERDYHPPDTSDSVHAVTLDNPLPDYKLLIEFDLQNILPYFNRILIYRIFKKLYDAPDIVAAGISINSINKSKINVSYIADWSYSLRINKSLIAEIRSLFQNYKFRLRFWSNCISGNNKAYGQLITDFDNFDKVIKTNKYIFGKQDLRQIIGNFLMDITKLIENNLCHFEEKTLKKEADLEGIPNIYLQRYKAAEMLINLADTFDIKEPSSLLKDSELPKVRTTGSIYLSSAIMFIISLESLINVLYYSLLKKEFASEQYERVTVKADLDLRLLCMHLYCDGFKSQIINPSTNNELWGKMIKLRDFRNTMIHGNVTDEDKAYALFEDHIPFFYSPAIDFRGESMAKKAKNRLPVSIKQINRTTVLEIKGIVDEITKTIISSMNKETKHWVKCWIKELFVPSKEQLKVYKQIYGF